MRVIIRQPAALDAEYDLPDLDNTATDSDILAAASTRQPTRRADPEPLGNPYVYARGPDDLAQQGRRIELAEQRLAQEKAAARQLARTAVDHGHPKRAVAAALGITRATLDAWLAQT